MTGNRKVAYHEQMITPFHAVADPTRREILERLRTSGPLSLSEVASGLPMSRQAVTKHLHVLFNARLVRSFRRGRQHIWELEPDRLADARDYLERIDAQWDAALERLEAFLEDE